MLSRPHAVDHSLVIVQNGKALHKGIAPVRHGAQLPTFLCWDYMSGHLILSVRWVEKYPDEVYTVA